MHHAANNHVGIKVKMYSHCPLEDTTSHNNFPGSQLAESQLRKIYSSLLQHGAYQQFISEIAYTSNLTFLNPARLGIMKIMPLILPKGAILEPCLSNYLLPSDPPNGRYCRKYHGWKYEFMDCSQSGGGACQKE